MSALEDAVGEMADDLLDEAGRSMTYFRDRVSAGTVTMSKHQQQSQYIDNGQGGVIEITPVDFLAKTSTLPFDPPLKGDKIVDGTATYEVLPTVSEKVFRRISPQMTRIHTKQVAS